MEPTTKPIPPDGANGNGIDHGDATGQAPGTHVISRVRLGDPGAKAVWACLLLITAAITIWPVTPLREAPMPVQSIFAIHSLPIFVGLLYVWTLLIAALLFARDGGHLERLALCMVFTVVFVQFWGFMSPWGNSGDSAWLTGHVKYLLESGRVSPSGISPFTYFDFPALPLLGLSVVESTGLDLFVAVRLYLLFSGLLISATLYAAFQRINATPTRAAISVILAILSSKVLGVVANQFHPINLATIYIVAFLLLFVIRGLSGFEYNSVRVVFLLLALASATEYLFTPVLLSMVIASAYVLEWRLRRRLPDHLALAVLPLLLLLAWDTYATVYNFRAMVISVPKILHDFQTGNWLLPTEQVLGGNVGGEHPWWENYSRLFWWIVVFGLGSLLLLRRTLSLKRIKQDGEELHAIFGGTLLTIGIGAIVIPGMVHGGFSRYIWVAPLALAPFLVELISRRKSVIVKRLAIVLAIGLLPPTFLGNASLLPSNRIYQSQLAASRFLSATYPRGEGITVYFGEAQVDSLYIPRSGFPGGQQIYGTTAESFWEHTFGSIREFRTTNSAAVFLSLSSDSAGRVGEQLGIGADDPNWAAVEDELAQSSQIYDSGYKKLYVP